MKKMFNSDTDSLSMLQSHIIVLRERILRVFPEEPVPDFLEIVSHDCSECRAVRDTLSGQRWRELSEETVASLFGDLPLLTPQAHHYYLPAFLWISLGRDWDNSLTDFTIYNLCPDDEDWWQRRFAVFSTSQLQTIACWLRTILDHPEFFQPDAVIGESGFQKYWKPRLI